MHRVGSGATRQLKPCLAFALSENHLVYNARREHEATAFGDITERRKTTRPTRQLSRP